MLASFEPQSDIMTSSKYKLIQLKIFPLHSAMAKKHECLRWFAPPQNEITENNLPTYLTDGLPPYLRHYLLS